jgi:hypothetical protein
MDADLAIKFGVPVVTAVLSVVGERLRRRYAERPSLEWFSNPFMAQGAIADGMLVVRNRSPRALRVNSIEIADATIEIGYFAPGGDARAPTRTGRKLDVGPFSVLQPHGDGSSAWTCRLILASPPGGITSGGPKTILVRSEWTLPSRWLVFRSREVRRRLRIALSPSTT